MQLTQAHAKLTRISAPAFRTVDAAAALGLTTAHASQVLRRLAGHGFIVSLKRGCWAFADLRGPWAVLEQLTAPAPAYISLQTALFKHGLITQIPNVIYAVSLSRSQVYKTPLGTFSVHHLGPSFFCGYEIMNSSQIKVASAEKALLDVLYLCPNQPALFRALPELAIPRSFSRSRCDEFISRITSPARRTMVANALREILQRRE